MPGTTNKGKESGGHVPRALRLRNVRWGRVIVRGALILLLSILSLGAYIVDLFLHPSVWNTTVFVGLLVLLGVMFYTNRKLSDPNRKRH